MAWIKVPYNAIASAVMNFVEPKALAYWNSAANVVKVIVYRTIAEANIYRTKSGTSIIGRTISTAYVVMSGIRNSNIYRTIARIVFKTDSDNEERK